MPCVLCGHGRGQLCGPVPPAALREKVVENTSTFTRDTSHHTWTIRPQSKAKEAGSCVDRCPGSWAMLVCYRDLPCRHHVPEHGCSGRKAKNPTLATGTVITNLKQLLKKKNRSQKQYPRTISKPFEAAQPNEERYGGTKRKPLSPNSAKPTRNKQEPGAAICLKRSGSGFSWFKPFYTVPYTPPIWRSCEQTDLRVTPDNTYYKTGQNDIYPHAEIKRIQIWITAITRRPRSPTSLWQKVHAYQVSRGAREDELSNREVTWNLHCHWQTPNTHWSRQTIPMKLRQFNNIRYLR